MEFTSVMPGQFFTAFQVHQTDEGTFHGRVVQRSVNDLPPGDVLVRVSFSSLNFKDALSTIGNRGVTRRYPHTPGIDAAGVVVESAVADFQVGDKVVVSCYDLGMNTAGGFGQYIRVPAAWVMPKPRGLTLRETMIIGTAGFTAAQSVERLVSHPLSPNDGKILVTGATGGVGSMAVSLLAKLGYQVAALTGKKDLTDFLVDLGASEILSRAEGLDTSGRMVLKEKWAGVIDTVGGDILTTAIKSTRYNGIVTCCGNAGGAELHLNVYPFILRGVTLAGIDSAECTMAQRIRIWEKLAGTWHLGNLERFTTEIPMADIQKAVADMLAGKSSGRILISLQN